MRTEERRCGFTKNQLDEIVFTAFLWIAVAFGAWAFIGALIRISEMPKPLGQGFDFSTLFWCYKRLGIAMLMSLSHPLKLTHAVCAVIWHMLYRIQREEPWEEWC